MRTGRQGSTGTGRGQARTALAGSRGSVYPALMVIGIGIDIASPARLKQAWGRRGPRLLARLFTPAERADCERARDPWPAYAARFAAKEALLKALGTGLRQGLGWQQIEVRHDALGKPQLVLSGRAAAIAAARGATRVHLSLSDLPELAVAQVLLERDGDGACNE
jgi:holo-[acyl-carrier protein] synthase